MCRITSKKLDEYLEWTHSKQTAETIQSALKQYMKANGIEDLDSYLTSKPDLKDHIKRFAVQIENLAPKTQVNYLSLTKTFLEEQFDSVPIASWIKKARKKNGIKRARPINMKDTPRTEDLRIILNEANIKEKALFGLMAVTGNRIGETLELTFDDIDLDNNFIQIPWKSAKNRQVKFIFFTDEVKAWLKQWITVDREKWIKTSYQKSKFLREKLEREGYTLKRQEFEKGKPNRPWQVFKDGVEVDVSEYEKRIFPFSYQNANKYWNRLLERTGYDRKNGKAEYSRRTYTIHSLKRFFKNQIKETDLNDSYANYFTAHLTDLQDTYLEFSYVELRDAYFTIANHLSIFTEKKEFDQKINGLNKLVTDHQRQLNEKQDTIKALEERLAKFEEKYGNFMKVDEAVETIDDTDKKAMSEAKTVDDKVDKLIKALKKQGIDVSAVLK